MKTFDEFTLFLFKTMIFKKLATNHSIYERLYNQYSFLTLYIPYILYTFIHI
jgi:hypothetical protein